MHTPGEGDRKRDWMLRACTHQELRLDLLMYKNLIIALMQRTWLSTSNCIIVIAIMWYAGAVFITSRSHAKL